MRTFCLPSLAMMALAGCATQFHAGAPKGAVNVIAHRGASAYAPENTLAAFERAIELQADWFELDCHLTRDGQLAVIHDGDLERVAGVKKHVGALPLEEVRALDAGAWFGPAFAGEKIPTLAEALDLAKGKIGVYIEIKSDVEESRLIGRMLGIIAVHDGGQEALRRALLREIETSRSKNLLLARKVIEAVRKRRMQHQVVLQSFSPVLCAIALAEAPDLRTEFLGAYDRDHPETWEQYVASGKAMGAAGFNINYDSLTPERLALFHHSGATCAVWTVDDPEKIRQAAALGVNAIITNKPDLCLETLRGLGKR